MNKDVDSEVTFKFLDAKLLVHRVKWNPAIILAHSTTLREGIIALYNFKRVELKTFTFSSGTQSLSLDNDVMRLILKLLLWTMVKNKEFLGSLDTKPYLFRQYDLRHFPLYVKGKQIPREPLYLDMSHWKHPTWDTGHSSRLLAYFTRTRVST